MKKKTPNDRVKPSPNKIKRREFMGRSAAAGAALATGGALFGGHPPAFASFDPHRWNDFDRYHPLCSCLC